MLSCVQNLLSRCNLLVYVFVEPSHKAFVSLSVCVPSLFELSLWLNTKPAAFDAVASVACYAHACILYCMCSQFVTVLGMRKNKLAQ